MCRMTGHTPGEAGAAQKHAGRPAGSLSGAGRCERPSGDAQGGERAGAGGCGGPEFPGVPAPLPERAAAFPQVLEIMP